MKLHTKITLFATLSTLVIVTLFILLLPYVMERIAFTNTNRNLYEQKDKVLEKIKYNGIDFYLQGDTTYGSYSMLKEEYISLEPTYLADNKDSVFTSERIVEEDTINYRILTHTFPVNQKKYLLEIGRQISSIKEDSRALQRAALYILIVLTLITWLSTLAYTRHILNPLGHIIKKRLKDITFPFTTSQAPVKTTTQDFKYLDESITGLMTQITMAFEKEREFTSNASHELTTPVSIMQTKIENMLYEPGLSIEQQQQLVGLMQTLKRLKKIVQSLLLISRIENQQYDSIDIIQPHHLIIEVMNELEHRLEEKSITIHTTLNPTIKLKTLNRDLIFQMFYNLINNAIRYNKVNGAITISDKTNTDGTYAITVSDTGIGIEKTHVQEIFNRFKKIAPVSGEGQGLGLSIVKSIVQHQKLQIFVDSVPNNGSSFTILFSKAHVE